MLFSIYLTFLNLLLHVKAMAKGVASFEELLSLLPPSALVDP